MLHQVSVRFIAHFRVYLSKLEKREARHKVRRAISLVKMSLCYLESTTVLKCAN